MIDSYLGVGLSLYHGTIVEPHQSDYIRERETELSSNCADTVGGLVEAWVFAYQDSVSCQTTDSCGQISAGTRYPWDIPPFPFFLKISGHQIVEADHRTVRNKMNENLEYCKWS